MEIDRDIEILGSSKERPVRFIVIKPALVVVVDEGADKAELLDTAS